MPRATVSVLSEVFTSDGDAICSVLFMTEWILVKHGRRWRATASNIPHILVEKCSWNFNLKKLLVLKELLGTVMCKSRLFMC